jgi:hypothetical protein
MSLETLPDVLIDSSQYPTDAFLDWLKEERDPNVALHQAAEYFRDCGYGRAWIDNGLLNLATGGWSGCEDVIGALADNLFVWAVAWQQSHRGGKHVFDYSGPEVV